MVKLITIIALLLCGTSLSNAATQTKQANWSRLGPNECYGQTCGLHEFCSDNPVRGQGCRNCSEIVGSSEDENSWCHPIRFEEFKRKFPSCESLCWIDRYQTHLGKVEGLSNTIESLNHSLHEEREKSARLDSELTETGKALNKALNDPTELKNLKATYEATVITLNETAEALEKSTAELAASRTSENKSKEDLNTQRAKFLETEAELSKTKKELNTTKESLSEARSGQHQADEENKSLKKENEQVHANLKETTDERYVLFIALAICGPLLVAQTIYLIVRCVRDRRKKNRQKNNSKLMNKGPGPPIFKPRRDDYFAQGPGGHAPDTIQMTPFLPQNGGNGNTTNNGPHHPTNGADSHPFTSPSNGHPTSTARIQRNTDQHPAAHDNNLSSNVPDTQKLPIIQKNVFAAPGPSQPVSEAATSSNNESPYSSTQTCSSEGSHRLAPSGNRTETGLDDQKDFTQTSKFQC